ncbi:metal transporter [Desulfosarcina sp.]|uniref:metal transporter n=1 Tax=Desulfosarcina sp. TaxID=2027861 RepID=UPI00356A223F
MPGEKEHPTDATAKDDRFCSGISVLQNILSASQTYLSGLLNYTDSFYTPYLLATQYFQEAEALRLSENPPADSVEAYLGLLENNIELMARSLSGSARMLEAYTRNEADDLAEALQQTFFEFNPTKLEKFTARQAELLDLVVNVYPKAIEAIEPEYGFHFERGEHARVDETDRFLLYRVAPSLPGVKTNSDAKPVLILPPYVLGANILGFLPGEQRSYAHCFANQGFPTYIRILKEIDTTPALQTMSGEDDALDTQRFCQTILKAHGKRVTLNGYCQGGYNALCNLLSGKLDDLVDAFITCVSPMDGTRSKGLASFLARLPQRFNDLDYGTKTLPNGNQVADGKLMGWVYKLKSIEQEIPAAAFYRDLMMFARQKNGDQPISKTAAALNYWLQNERYDLPLEITRISFAAYNTPITADGTLPVRLFGGKLNLKRLKEKNIPWLICYGTHDDLVEKETALAPLDHVDAEVTPFPKGHVAIATSWSSPQSACALHTRFGEGNYRGPVRYHMDLDAALDETKRQAASASPPQPIAPAPSAAGRAAKKPDRKTTAARKTTPRKTTGAAKKTKKATPATKKKPKAKAKAAPAKTKRTPASRIKRTEPASPRGGK